MTDAPERDLPVPQLRRTRPLQRGYRQAEVNQFVDDLQRAYRHDPPTMAPYEVADQRFAPTRFGKGYTMQSVDSYLDEAREQLRERHGTDAVAAVEGRRTEHRHFPTELIYVAAVVLILAMVVFALTQL